LSNYLPVSNLLAYLQLATLDAFLLLPLLDSKAAAPLVLLANKGIYNNQNSVRATHVYPGEVSRGRHALEIGGTQTDSLIVVVNYCRMYGSRDRVYELLSDMSDDLFAASKCSNTTFITIKLVYEDDVNYFV
jgi:hypothetical protein